MLARCLFRLAVGLWCVVLAHAVVLAQAASRDGLKSDRWRERVRAWDAVLVPPKWEPSPSLTPSLLLDLLEAENRYNELRLAGKTDQDTDEGYSEYYAGLMDACYARCDRSNPRTMEALLRGPYDPDSELAANLLRTYGEKLLPTLLDLSRGRIKELRYQAIGLLGHVHASGTPLTQAQRKLIHASIVSGMRDPFVPARSMAVEALGRIGDPTDVHLLEDVAKHDSTMVSARGKTRYPVREFAVEAMP